MAKSGQGINQQTAWLVRKSKRVANSFALFNARQSVNDATPVVITDWFWGTAVSEAILTSNATFGVISGTGDIDVLLLVDSNRSFGAITGTGLIEITDPDVPTPPQNVYLRPMQVLGYRVMAQRPAYIRPTVNGFLFPIYQKTHKIPAKTGYLAPAYQRKFIILNPTDS